MRREYDFAAKLYDPLLHIFLNPIRKAVVEELTEYKDSLIIDLCCGTGNQLKILEKNEFKSLHCLDLSDPMLQVAKKDASNIEIYKADATRTPFDDDTFDVGIISFAVHEKDRIIQDKLLNEAHRIIKGDGVLLIVDFDFDDQTAKIAKFFINTIEKIAGGEHYRNFLNYKLNSGLNGLIKPDKFELIKKSRRSLNSIAIASYKIM